MWVRLFVVLFFTSCSLFSFAKTERVKKEDVTANSSSSELSEESVRAVIDAMRIIKEEYINTVSDSKLSDAAITGMLSSLDPHSTYLNKEDASELSLHSSGEFEGIGIEITSDNGIVRVVTPIDDGPAFKVGIKAGDYILSINDETIYGMPIQKIVQKIRGKPGTSIKLTVIRENNPSPMEFKLRREKVNMTSVKTSMLIDDILYIRISYFYRNTSKILEDSLKRAFSMNKNIKGVVLDLRNNPGGFLDQSVKVSSIFLDKGDVVYTKGKNEINMLTYPVDKNVFKVSNIPIVVLINNSTASAAEIVAGALQDHKKAAIVGTSSFGKGSVQTLIDIDEDRSIGLTTALYYTPSGKPIQLKGVVPDITIEDIEIKKYRDGYGFREEDIQGHLEQKDNMKITNKPNFVEKIKKKFHLENVHNNEDKHLLYNGDFMLIRAVDLIKGINIYNNKAPIISNIEAYD